MEIPLGIKHLFLLDLSHYCLLLGWLVILGSFFLWGGKRWLDDSALLPADYSLLTRNTPSALWSCKQLEQAEGEMTLAVSTLAVSTIADFFSLLSLLFSAWPVLQVPLARAAFAHGQWLAGISPSVPAWSHAHIAILNARQSWPQQANILKSSGFGQVWNCRLSVCFTNALYRQLPERWIQTSLDFRES